MKKFVQYRHCSDVYGQYYPFLILHSQERNPLRVAEAVHESSARINEIVPGHPDSLPEGGRITPIIYVWGGQAESEYSPLSQNVPLGQGIVLFKFNEKPGFSCN